MRPLGAESETILSHRNAHGGPSYVTIVTRNLRWRASADARNLRQRASDRNVRLGREREAVCARRDVRNISSRRERQSVPVSSTDRTRLRGGGRERSEEHTSELQSQSNLVCRLLLEK